MVVYLSVWMRIVPIPFTAQLGEFYHTVLKVTIAGRPNITAWIVVLEMEPDGQKEDYVVNMTQNSLTH